MRAIVHLLTRDEPLTMETDWFTLRNARLHLRPFTQPHFPLAVASAGSPAGMLMAGKFGLDVIGISAPRGDYTLADFWRIAEETAAQNETTVWFPAANRARRSTHRRVAASERERRDGRRARPIACRGSGVGADSPLQERAVERTAPGRARTCAPASAIVWHP